MITSRKKLNDPEANEESDVTENAFLAPKRQKYSSNTGELSGEKSQETKTPAISLSSKTLEKIKYFSAHHDASTSYEKMEYDDLGRKNEEDGKKNKIKLVDNHYSEHCLTASSFIETNNLSSAYNQSPRSPTKSCTTTSSGTNMKYTPLEQQVLELKRKHGGMILMIQTAYKYTFFGEDAEVASRVLNIMVTQHHNFLTAVIPTVRLHVHIRRLVEEGKQKIYWQLKEVYGDTVMNERNVKKWCKMFNNGRTNVHDETRPGRPSLITEDLKTKVNDRILQDRRTSLDELHIAFPDISRSLLGETVLQHLGYHKICARWVPRQLSDQHKTQRMASALTFLMRYHTDGDAFLDQIVTGDETWVSHNTPETKRQSRQWHHPSSPKKPRKFKQTLSTQKVMATVFWDCKGVLLLDFMPKGTMINANRYCETLRNLRRAIQNKRRGMLSRGVVLLHDNARPHTTASTRELLDQFGWEIFDHPPYSPDLAPSDFHLFTKLKDFLVGTRFGSDEELKKTFVILCCAGYKVGVVNQTETAAMKAAGENKNTPFTRELANVYTKATLIGKHVDPLSQEGEFIQGGNFASYIMCIAESPDTVPSSQPKSANLAIVAFDPSTGDTVYDSFEDGPCREELERRFEHLDPAEIIVPQTISQETERLVKHSSARLETLEDGVFNFTGALVQVADFFCAQEDSESNSQKLNSMADLPPLTVVCLSALIHHLKQFGLARALRSNSLRHFTSDSRYVKMDATVLRNLEIFKSGLGTHKGSLIWALDHTRTKFGSRLLHDWVSQPVRDLAILQSRQEAITELLQSESAVVQQLEKILDGIPDIDRGLTTCIHQRIGPPSLCAVLRTLGKLQTDLESVCDFVDADLKSPLLQDLIKDALFNLSNIGPFLQNLNQQAARWDIMDGDKTKLLHDYSAFPSVMKRIDEISSVTKQLDNLKPAIARKLGLLKFDYITVSGQEFLIEVKQNQKKSVPNSWRKISETKQAIRYRSPEVDSLYREMSHLREQLINDCHSAWLLFLSDFNAHYFAHKRAIKNLATLDVLFSLVQVAKQDGYCRPTLLDSEETIIDIEKGRHPVIPLLFTSTEQFVSNNTRLKITVFQSDEECCMILSGPNMGGKSCYIRQVALIAIMAHIGSYVPAECATISILDSVFTRMGARDELFQGRSTLMLELEEASVILRRATCKSLVLLDELGRGTSSCDGTSIAIATLHHLLTESLMLAGNEFQSLGTAIVKEDEYEEVRWDGIVSIVSWRERVFRLWWEERSGPLQSVRSIGQVGWVRCLILFVTHYPAVMELENQYVGKARNYHMAFILHNKDSGSEEILTFLYEVTCGSAGRSYGLNVARLANVPQCLLQRASEKAQMLESWTVSK
ncbi:hypothetical protein ANN_15417, partial [Periplaneta americana]